MHLLKPLVNRLRSLLAALLLTLAVVPHAAAVDFTDIWWNSLESGWGVNLVQSDNFMFATFFIYGADQQPTWYAGNMTQDAQGVWSGPLYRTTGSYFGVPWNTAEGTLNAVGTVTFVPSASSAYSYAGTLTYNVGTVSVTKQITRQTLTTIALGASYSGAQVSIFSGCNDPSQNGQVSSFVNMTVAQSLDGQLQLDFANPEPNGGSCRMAGASIQNGQLFRIPNGAYTCGTSFATSVVVSQIKATAQGIEGQWVAPIGAGCVESGYFSAVYTGP